MSLQNNSRFLTLFEVLDKINKDTSLLKTDFKKNGVNPPLERVFRYAFDEKWELPEGDPPYTPSKFNEGQTDDLLVIVKKGRLDYFSSRKYPQLSKSKREELFIKTLESVHRNEAEVLLLIKDQCLTDKYPNITRDLLVENGYLPKKETVGSEVRKSNTKTFRKPVKTETDKKSEGVSKSKKKKS